jgi:DinB family protein
MNSERRRALESFGNGAVLLTAALRRFPRKMWLYKKSQDSRSIHEVVWALADREVIEYIYCRRFVVDPGSPAVDIEPSAWPDRLGYFYHDIKDAMGIVRALRRSTYRFLASLPERAWTYTVEFPIHGQLSLEAWLGVRESYLPEQIQQMTGIYSEWLESTSAVKTVRTVRKSLSSESLVS